MRKVVIASNMKNEADQILDWYNNMKGIADYMLVVLGTSTDASYDILMGLSRGGTTPLVVIKSDIITEKGYGESRNDLRNSAKQYFPDSEWVCFFDADERIDESEFHYFRHLKDSLSDRYDVIGFPRIDWHDLEKTKMEKDWKIDPDYQARMTRLDSPLKYVRMLHEQVTDFRGMYCDIHNPKINHFHRVCPESKRTEVGKCCAYLHMNDKEFGDTYPEHHKEKMYREMIVKEGL